MREAKGGAHAAQSTYKCLLDPDVPADPYILEVRDYKFESDWETNNTTSTDCNYSNSGGANDSGSSNDLSVPTDSHSTSIFFAP